VGLLDLVEEHQRVRLAADGLVANQQERPGTRRLEMSVKNHPHSEALSPIDRTRENRHRKADTVYAILRITSGRAI